MSNNRVVQELSQRKRFASAMHNLPILRSSDIFR